MSKNKVKRKTKGRRKNIQRSKLPESFRYLLWSYRFPEVDPEEDKERIIVNTINYGNWKHWQWIVNYYGAAEVKRTIENLPASEFRPSVLKLLSLLLKIKRMKYATRSAKIRAEKNL